MPGIVAYFEMTLFIEKGSLGEFCMKGEGKG